MSTSKQLFATIGLSDHKELRIYSLVTVRLIKALTELNQHRQLTSDELKAFEGSIWRLFFISVRSAPARLPS